MTALLALSAETIALLGIFVPALVAALGFVGKQVVQTLHEWRAEREERRARLHELEALLRASRATFLVQRQLADRLAKRIRAREGLEAGAGGGLERLFVQAHPSFDPEDADLHGIIRAYTEHTLLPLNEATLAWLKSDVHYRISRGKAGDEAQLAEQLNQLDAHLHLWLAKYKAWIPERPDHALVYLADEEEHGLGFPRGIEDTVSQVLSRTA